MRLRTKKRLLNFASLGVLLSGAGALAAVWRLPDPPVDARPSVTPVATVGAPSRKPVPAPTLNAAHWNRTLRQPLYDPPPPPPKEVVVEIRPISVKLVGTVIEPENSQAFVRQATGKVEIKRVGDGVTAETADGVIAAITPTEIVIRRKDGEHRVPVERR